MKKLNVGILGYGKMGRVYTHWFSENPNCNLYAIYNRSLSKLDDISTKYPNIQIYNNWKDLIANDAIDIIGLCTPSYERLSQITFALQNNKHIICEKPMCMDVNECNIIKRKSLKSKGTLFIASELLLHPVIIKATELLEKIEPIIHIDFSYSMFRREQKWKHTLQAGGGILRELGGHLLDLSNKWLGPACFVSAHNKVVLPKHEVEDLSINIIEYENNASVLISNHYFERAENKYNGKIYGANGEIIFSLSSYKPSDSTLSLYTDHETISFDFPHPKNNDIVYPGHMDSFKKTIDSFVDAIINNLDLRYSIENESTTMQIIDASYLSQQKNIKVSLPLRNFNYKNLFKSYRYFRIKPPNSIQIK